MSNGKSNDELGRMLVLNWPVHPFLQLKMSKYSFTYCLIDKFAY